MTVSGAKDMEVVRQFAKNILLESGRDLRDDLDGVAGLLRFEDGKLVSVATGGLEFPSLSDRLFSGIDVSHVRTIRVIYGCTNIIEEGTFRRFDRLEKVKLDNDNVMHEFGLIQDEIDRINFVNLKLLSDFEKSREIVDQFLQNYKKELGRDISDEYLSGWKSPTTYGFEVKWGELVDITLCLPLPIITAGLFKGIDVSNVAEVALRSCKIEEIEDGAFDDFTSLLKLDLRKNRLSMLPRISEEILSNLFSIQIQQNNITRYNIQGILREWLPEHMTFFKGEETGSLSVVDLPNEIWINHKNLHEYISI